MKADKKYPCECGSSFDTARDFSDHVHNTCKSGTVPWKPTSDYLAARAAEEKKTS